MASSRHRLSPRLLIACAAFALLTVGLSSCGGGGKTAETASTPTAVPLTPKPIPPPVSISPEPQGVGLEDPAFSALPGTKVDFGRLGGAVYQVEVPDHWNGRLVLYMHGFQGLAPKASVTTPAIRQYLVRNGYAWGASSFSSTSLIPGRAADETAALWDYFVGKFGQPQRTYVMGHSMGGAGVEIAAERYGDRFDGALAMCGYAGQPAESQIVGDYFYAGAYVAGVTQAEFDSTNINNLINDRIRPALRDAAKEKEFEDILIGLTGGPRPFDREGIRGEDATNWLRTVFLVPTRISYNSDRTYALPPSSGVSSADFNANVVRVTPDNEKIAAFNDGNLTTGDLAMPMLTLHTTGDFQVPVDQEQTLARKVDAAGKGGLLVQRLVQAPGHCGFTDSEWERAFADLVDWVESGRRPAGENVLVDNLSRAGEQFTLAARYGSTLADNLPGAGRRITVGGTLTRDGQPMDDTFFWVEVRRDGLRQVCSFTGDAVRDGRYTRAVASDTELAGCGGPGSDIVVSAYVSGKLLSSPPVPWPTSGNTVTLDAAFSSAAAGSADGLTPVFGAVYDAAGNRMPAGTKVEAYIGSTLCGVTSLPAAVMQFANPDSFNVLVVGPDANPGCTKDGAITFRVNGTTVAGNVTNDLKIRGHALDLTLPPGIAGN